MTILNNSKISNEVKNNILLKSALALAIVDLVLIATILVQVNNLVKDVLELQSRQAEIERVRERLKEKQAEIEVLKERLRLEKEIAGNQEQKQDDVASIPSIASQIFESYRKMKEVKVEERVLSEIPQELKNMDLIYKKSEQGVLRASIDGARETTLISGTKVVYSQTTISPDRKKIAFRSDDDTQLNVLMLDTKKIQTLVTTPSKKRQIGGFIWGTDSQTIVYSSFQFAETPPPKYSPSEYQPIPTAFQTRMVDLAGNDTLIGEQSRNFIAYLSDKQELWVIVKPGLDKIVHFAEILIVDTQTRKERKVIFGNQNWSIYGSSWQYSSDYSKIYFLAHNEKQESILVEYNILDNIHSILALNAGGNFIVSLNSRYIIYTSGLKNRTLANEKEIVVLDLTTKEKRIMSRLETGGNTRPLFWLNDDWTLFFHVGYRNEFDVSAGKGDQDLYYAISVDGQKVLLKGLENISYWPNFTH